MKCVGLATTFLSVTLAASSPCCWWVPQHSCKAVVDQDEDATHYSLRAATYDELRKNNLIVSVLPFSLFTACRAEMHCLVTVCIHFITTANWQYVTLTASHASSVNCAMNSDSGKAGSIHCCPQLSTVTQTILSGKENRLYVAFE